MAKANKKAKESKDEALHLTGKFAAAIEYARHLHIERRKGTDIPYMAHLLGVASLVMGESGHASVPVTEDMVVAALLHDTVEDHGGTLREKDVEANFGANVARMVHGLSDSFAEDSEQKDSWEDRKKSYIRRLKREPADVQLISAADKLYNARSILEDYRIIGPEIWRRFHRGRDQQLWYFKELIKVYRMFGKSRIVDELARVVKELKRESADEGRTSRKTQRK